jgi:hypothetical protein
MKLTKILLTVAVLSAVMYGVLCAIGVGLNSSVCFCIGVAFAGLAILVGVVLLLADIWGLSL